MDYNLTLKNWQFLQYSSYFSPGNNLLYISTPKVACTSLKWWFARMEGSAAAIRQCGGSMESAPELVIHDTFHKVAPMVAGLEPQVLSTLFQSPEVTRFALVRNPYKRIFSAWQSKLLLQEPLQSPLYLNSEFFHTHISAPENIAYAFESFLEHLASEEAPTFWDPHWTPQIDLLHPQSLPYTLISQLEDTSELEDLLRSKLGAAFINPFTSSNSNESLIPYSDKFFSQRSVKLIEELYHRDFEFFGYEKSLPPAKSDQSQETFKVAVKGIEMLKSRHNRIADFQQRIRSTETQLHQQHSLASERASLIGKLLEANETLTLRTVQKEQEQDREVVALAESQAQHARLQDELRQRNTKIAELTQALAEHVLSSEAHFAELNTRNQEIVDLKSELNESTRQMSELQQTIDEHSQKGEHFGKILSERNKELSRLRQYRAQAELRIEELTTGDTALRSQLHTQSEYIQSLHNRIATYENLSRDLAQALESLSQKKRQLRQDLMRSTELAGKFSESIVQYERITSIYSKALGTAFASRAWRLQSMINRASSSPRQLLSKMLITELAFDRDAYLASYPDVAQAHMTPEEHFLAFGLAEKRLYSLISDVTQTRQLPQTSVSTAKSTTLIDNLLESLKSIQIGNTEDAVEPTSALNPIEFDAEFYLSLYPDLRAAGVDPAEHYQLFGKAEGRIGSLPAIRGAVDSLDPRKKTVMVVSHEASRTGAPILSLNLAQTLAPEYNVIAVLLGGGDLEDAFVNADIAVVGPVNVRSNPELASLIMGRLLDQFPVDLALVNSIESRAVLPALAERFIPTLSLIHEFAAYTRPRQAFRDALFWSGETIFSADLTLQSAQSEYPELSSRLAHVIPQGRSVVPPEDIRPETMAKERARIQHAMRPPTQPEDTVVILGAGYVQLRKGVDLFIECAARVTSLPGGEKCRFVWIGQGYDPDQDTNYSVYLADQIRRAGLEAQVSFVTETSAIDTVYESADLLLLTSRLDPLPNVAIDAMDHGLPVLCFDKTTGIADFLQQNDLADSCVAPYLDTNVMADRILAIAMSTELRKDVGERCRLASRKYFDMAKYVARLEELASDVQIRCRQEKADLITIEQSTLPVLDFVLPPAHSEMERSQGLRLYVRSWASGIGCRKPFAGFHPGIYLAENNLDGAGIDPLADYIRAGEPQGPWSTEVLTPATPIESGASELRIALHIHAYYPDLLPEILERLNINEIIPDLYISVPNKEAEARALELLNDFEGHFIKVEVVPNTGRDIGPMLAVFGTELIESYDIIGHIHTKKTVDVPDPTMGQAWFRFLLDNLLGVDSSRMADIILGKMSNQPSLGMVFAEDPNITGWSANKLFAMELAPRLGLNPETLPEHFNFPVGTMFWARTATLAPFVKEFADLAEYPEEPLPYDGSMLHAIERLLPIVCRENGSTLAVTYVPGSSR